MAKTTKRKTIPVKERDEVQIRRNFIEQTLLNLKHFVANNSKKVFRFSLLTIAVFFLSIVLYGLQSWFSQNSYEELYKAKNEIKKALEEMQYISLISSSKDKKGKDKLIEESKKEMEKRFASGIRGLNEVSNSIIFFFSDARELALYEIGLAYLNKKDYMKSIKYLNEFYRNNEDNFLSNNAIEMEALAYEQMESYPEALKRYKKLYNKDPKSNAGARALYSMGRMNERIGKKEEALKNYKKLIKGFRERSFYYSRLAKKRLYLLSLKKS